MVFVFWIFSMVCKQCGFAFASFYVCCCNYKACKSGSACAFCFLPWSFFANRVPFDSFAFFDGNLSTIIPLSVLTLKVATVSLASITVFSGLDPDRLCAGLLYFGCPDKLSFSIAFSYRILPMLMEQFQNILFSYRLRGVFLKKAGVFGWLKICFTK